MLVLDAGDGCFTVFSLARFNSSTYRNLWTGLNQSSYVIGSIYAHFIIQHEFEQWTTDCQILLLEVYLSGHSLKNEYFDLNTKQNCVLFLTQQGKPSQ